MITETISTNRKENYGGISQEHGEKLTYTWTDIDVFGEAQKEQSFQGSGTAAPNIIISKLKACVSRNYQHIPRPRKHLLKNVSGIARPGELLAVMGSSGAGKTTLLNSLAFRSPAGVQVSHSVIRALNGVPVNAKQLRARCAYIQQDDLFIGSLTAREHLIFQV